MNITTDKNMPKVSLRGRLRAAVRVMQGKPLVYRVTIDQIDIYANVPWNGGVSMVGCKLIGKPMTMTNPDGRHDRPWLRL